MTWEEMKKIEFSPNQVSLFGIQLQNRIKNYNEKNHTNLKNHYLISDNLALGVVYKAFDVDLTYWAGRLGEAYKKHLFSLAKQYSKYKHISDAVTHAWYYYNTTEKNRLFFSDYDTDLLIAYSATEWAYRKKYISKLDTREAYKFFEACIKNKYAQTIDDCFDMEDHSDENSDN